MWTLNTFIKLQMILRFSLWSFNAAVAAIALFISHSIHSFSFTFIHNFFSIHKISLLIHCYNFSGACMRIIWYDVCLWFCFIFLCIVPLLLILIKIDRYCYFTIGFSFCQWETETYSILFISFFLVAVWFAAIVWYICATMIFTQWKKNCETGFISADPIKASESNESNQIK